MSRVEHAARRVNQEIRTIVQISIDGAHGTEQICSIGSSMTARIEVILVVGGIENGIGFDLLAVVVDKDVFHYRKHPRLEVRVRLKFIAIEQRAICSLLIQVFRVLHVLPPALHLHARVFDPVHSVRLRVLLQLRLAQINPHCKII